MPPVWLCPDCHGVAYGWATGPCIHCGSNRTVSSDPAGVLGYQESELRLRFFTQKAWAQLEAEAIIAGQSTRELIAEREKAEVVMMRREPVDNGQLVLLRPNAETSQSRKPS